MQLSRRPEIKNFLEKPAFKSFGPLVSIKRNLHGIAGIGVLGIGDVGNVINRGDTAVA